MAHDNPETYRRNFNKYGVSPKALKWKDTHAQDRRLKEIVKDIDFEGKSVLDVGCGFGDLIPYISAKTDNFKYTGIDIVPEFIEFAKSKYPQHEFQALDYFSKPTSETYDIVISSGTLNNRTQDPMEDRKKNISTLFEHAREVLAFNMAGGYPQPQNSDKSSIYYADSRLVVDYCLQLSSKVVLRHNYHPKDFTILLFR